MTYRLFYLDEDASGIFVGLMAQSSTLPGGKIGPLAVNSLGALPGSRNLQPRLSNLTSTR
jgi:hypothetical protein